MALHHKPGCETDSEPWETWTEALKAMEMWDGRQLIIHFSYTASE